MKKKPILIWLAILVPLCLSLSAQEGGYELSYHVQEPSGDVKLAGEGRRFGDSLEVYRFLRQQLNDLHRQGYLAASFDSLSFLPGRVLAFLYPGRQYRWASLSFDSIDRSILRQSRIREKQLQGAVVDPSELAAIKERLIRVMENSGYPFARVYLDRVGIAGEGINAFLMLERNGLYHIDSVIIKGNAKLAGRFFERLTGVAAGDVYREDRLGEMSTRISETGFLEEVRPFELEFYQSGVDLYHYIDKGRGNRFNGIIGLLPDHSKSGRLLLTGDVNLLLINSIGRGESLFLSWKKLEPLTQELHLDVNYPFVFNTLVGTGLRVDLYKQDTSFLRVSPLIRLNFFPDGMNSLSAWYHYDNTILLGKTGEGVLEELPANTGMTSSLYGLGLNYRDLDYRDNPRKGFFASLDAGIGMRRLEDRRLTRGDIAIEERSTKFSGHTEAGVFVPLAGSFTFMARNRSGLIRAPQVFDNELYRLGGLNSMRGSEEQSILASAYSFFSAEFRYLFERNSNFYLFFDGGWYERRTHSKDFNDAPFGFGAGVSLQSGVGIFTVSYALGRAFDNPVNIGRSKIHLGYVSRF